MFRENVQRRTVCVYTGKLAARIGLNPGMNKAKPLRQTGSINSTMCRAALLPAERLPPLGGCWLAAARPSLVALQRLLQPGLRIVPACSAGLVPSKHAVTAGCGGQSDGVPAALPCTPLHNPGGSQQAGPQSAARRAAERLHPNRWVQTGVAPGLSAPCCSCMRCPASSRLLTCGGGGPLQQTGQAVRQGLAGGLVCAASHAAGSLMTFQCCNPPPPPPMQPEPLATPVPVCWVPGPAVLWAVPEGSTLAAPGSAGCRGKGGTCAVHAAGFC